MLSIKFILVAAAAFASTVSAVPTPEIGNSLNIAQRSPAVVDDATDVASDAAGLAANAAGLAANAASLAVHQADAGQLIDGLLVDRGGGLAVGGNPPAKRGGSSCKEVIQKCYDDIAVIVVKIS